MLAHILTLRGILGVPRTPRTLLWLTFGSILTYPLLGEMYSFSMYYVIIVLLRYFWCKEAKIGQTKYLETTRR